ncbi:MAG: insulinase family protein, partial [Bacteroidetes bacterium]|nr:insulinase family protein [Bacteroidota bacterium]
ENASTSMENASTSMENASTSMENASTSMEERDAATWIPDVREKILPNGLRILFTRVNDIPLAEMSVIVDAGIMRDPMDVPAVAYVTNQLMLRGSRDWSRDMLERRLDQLGTIVLPYAHYDYAQVYAKMLTKNFRSSLELVADAVLHPTFPEQELDVFKREASTTLVRMGRSSGERATIHTLRMLCGNTTAVAQSMLPLEGEVARLKAADLRRFHAEWYRPEHTTVIVTGDLDFDFLLTIMTEFFGRWESPEKDVTGNNRPDNGGAEHDHGASADLTAASPATVTVINDTTTTKGLAYYRFGAPMVARADADVPALLSLVSILAEGDSSRLRQKMWGDNVISPTFASTLVFTRSCSYLMISGSAPPAMAGTIYGLLSELLTDLAQDDISESELIRARTSLLAESPLLFSSNRSMQKLLKEAVVYGISIDDALRVSADLAAVSKEDIQRVARTLLDPLRFHLTVLGNGRVLQESLREIDRDLQLIELPDEP